MVGSTNTAAIMQYSLEYRFYPNNTLLDDYASIIGASFTENPAEVFLNPPEFVKNRFSLTLILLLLAVVLFLCDIAIRRFHVDVWHLLRLDKLQKKINAKAAAIEDYKKNKESIERAKIAKEVVSGVETAGAVGGVAASSDGTAAAAEGGEEAAPASKKAAKKAAKKAKKQEEEEGGKESKEAGGRRGTEGNDTVCRDESEALLRNFSKAGSNAESISKRTGLRTHGNPDAAATSGSADAAATAGSTDAAATSGSADAATSAGSTDAAASAGSTNAAATASGCTDAAKTRCCAAGWKQLGKSCQPG